MNGLGFNPQCSCKLLLWILLVCDLGGIPPLTLFGYIQRK